MQTKKLILQSLLASAIFIVISLLLFSCGQNKAEQAQKYYKNAVQSFNSYNFPAALIDFRKFAQIAKEENEIPDSLVLHATWYMAKCVSVSEEAHTANHLYDTALAHSRIQGDNLLLCCPGNCL